MTPKSRPGDVVFFVTSGVSGEALVIGYDAKDESTLVIAIGAQITELPAANCSPTGRSEGHSARAIGVRISSASPAS
jgi:hypothetical protein